MLTLKRNHTRRTRLEATEPAEIRDRFQGCTEAQTHTTGTVPAAGSEVSIGIDQILSMRVGCWRPPVYVNDYPPR